MSVARLRAFAAACAAVALSLPPAPAAEELPVAAVTNKAASADEINAAFTEMERLTEVMMLVRRHYVDEKSYRQIVAGAVQGMLQQLDPHSCYMEPEAYEDMQDETSGRYGGIGIQLGVKDEGLTIIAPIEGTPGFRAGLQSGDRIVAINDEKTAGITLRDAVKKLRGEKGTRVTLTIQRAGEDKPREVVIVRELIEVPSLRGESMLDGQVGYVRLTQFAAPTPDGLQRSLENLVGKGMKALVLDLRNNPGGLLDSAVRVSEKFLNKGDLVVTVRGRDGSGPEIARTARGDRHYVDFPMAVLVNGGSASASEIVAGALRDNGRAVLIGDTTFGKGSVQSVIPLRADDSCAIRLTTARYHTPSGREIHNQGVEPDIRVYVPPDEWRKVLVKRAKVENAGYAIEGEQPEDLTNVSDRPLQRAVDLLHAILVFRPARSGS